MDLVIHPATKRILQAVVANPPHALLLQGLDGTGKGTLAQFLACRLLELEPSKVATSPLVSIIDRNDSISIEDIRALKGFTKLRISSKNSVKRIIIVEHCGKMTHEAQNAFLKLLEEPPEDAVIILTASNSNQLLPTILSRVVVVNISKPAETELKRHFAQQGYSPKVIDKAYAISGGLPGLMFALLDSEAEAPLVGYIDKAKELLSSGKFERMVKLDEFIKQKQDPALLLEALDRVVRALLDSAVKSDKQYQVAKWHKVSKEINQKQKDLTSNPNNKLLLTDLVLNI
jgi:DNA polymerase-3 subunit delta'